RSKMAGIVAWFWNERFWLPHNVTWADLKNTDEATFPQAEDLYLAFPLAFCIFMIRLVFERFIARPCALGLKIQANGPQKAQPNAILEKVFTAITKASERAGHTACGHPDEKRLEGLSKQLDWDVRTIQRWFRQRRNQEKPSTLSKFCESMWRFTFYLYIFTYGVRFLKKVEIYILSVYIYIWSAVPEKDPFLTGGHPRRLRTRRGDEREGTGCEIVQPSHREREASRQTSWLWDTRDCWYNYPYQTLTTELHYYYIVELAFYWSLMFSQFTDIKRKDFLIMFLHHLATISLITFSYVNNMVRVGTLVMCLHDVSDVLLEAAKMANYVKCQRLCDLLFVMFGLVFISTRLAAFPIWILNTTVFESWDIVGPYPSWWVFNLLLFLLQVLHSFWSYLIIKIACKAISKGKVGKWNPMHVSNDDRSDIESSSDEEDAPSPAKKTHNTATNGTNGANGTNGYLTGTTCLDEH
ncbi:CERS6 synthase, partial [Polyodon spathula]|nr:CERS6 synthase [Polyodon spathula]